ncbi:MAG: mitochondrial fission ELM1 family protein [Nitrospirota bacterium]|nr:mitochondrial fission ELM1 family protein [Nitrospirota bacterium]
MSGADCWIVTDGRASMRNQCLGLAEALGFAAVHKLARPRPWRRVLPVGFWPPSLAVQGPSGDPLCPPWPRVLIACGQNAVHLSVAVRRASGGRTFTVQLENPGVAPRHFDLVVPPRHDGLSGPNVFPSLGALNRVTPALLKEAAEHFGPRFAHLPRPLVAVLVGGTSRRYRLTDGVARQLVAALHKAADGGAGLLVTASRRTGPTAMTILREGLRDLPAVFWGGEGENPYSGFLALANHLVVTCDSAVMISEAIATGKPVYLAQLEGDGGKFARFHRDLRSERRVVDRPFDGTLVSDWTPNPLDDAARVAAEVLRRLKSNRPTGRQ